MTVEDSLVTFKGLSAAAAGGTITGDGQVDLTGDVIRVQLAVAAQRLDVTRIPPNWGLNEVVERGLFSGAAHLLIDLPPGGPVRTGGEGRFVVTNARLLGAAAEGPVELSLQPTGGGFRFGTGSGTSQPSQRSDSLISFLAKKVVKLLLAYSAEKDGRTGRARIRFGLRDLDLANVIRRIPVAMPFPVAGRVSIRVEVDLPAETPDDLVAYRIDGSVEASTLRLEGVTFQQIKVRMAYRDGVLRLEELSGLLSDPTGATRFVGSARLGVIPVGDLAARLSVSRLPLGLLARLAPAVDLGEGGAVSGALELAIPAARLKDVTAWDGNATFRSPAATAFGWTLRNFDAGLTLRRDRHVDPAPGHPGRSRGAGQRERPAGRRLPIPGPALPGGVRAGHRRPALADVPASGPPGREADDRGRDGWPVADAAVPAHRGRGVDSRPCGADADGTVGLPLGH